MKEKDLFVLLKPPLLMGYHQKYNTKLNMFHVYGITWVWIKKKGTQMYSAAWAFFGFDQQTHGWWLSHNCQ